MTPESVWKSFLRLLHDIYGSRVYKWGVVMWVDIKGELQDYDKENANFALHTRCRSFEEVLPCMPLISVPNEVV